MVTRRGIIRANRERDEQVRLFVRGAHEQIPIRLRRLPFLPRVGGLVVTCASDDRLQAAGPRAPRRPVVVRRERQEKNWPCLRTTRGGTSEVAEGRIVGDARTRPV